MTDRAGVRGTDRYLVVSLEGVECAVPLELVTEIRGVPVLGRERGQGEAVVGTMEVRGRPTAVYDLRAMVGLKPSRRGGDGSVLLVRGGTSRCALLVDRVLEIAELAGSEIDPVASGAPVDAAFVRGVADRPSRLIVLRRDAILSGCAGG